MALGSREILLVIRARDEASRSLRFLASNLRHTDRDAAAAAASMVSRGAALFSLGAGFASVGVGILNSLDAATDAAMEYERLARLTLTQVDGVTASLQELEDTAISVGRKIPIPLEELQTTLYDIFSTIDVSMPEAAALLEGFAKQAVTGQSDIQKAAMTTIAILNAFQMPLSELGHIQDVQFQAVRKGALTYDELASNIGKAIPAAVQAGQTFDDLASMMSFLTRGGLSAAMASTSAARALEVLSNPKTVKRLEDMGVTVRDTSGEFLPMIDIFGQINEKTKDLASPERNAIIQELLSGAGNSIQARRFWIRALTNFEELKKHRDWMANSEGTFEEAYKTMFESPTSKIDLMNNKLQSMRIEIGEKLIPVKVRLAEAISAVLDAWARLGPKAQKVIVMVLAAVGVFSALLGIVLMVAGVWLLLSAAATIAGVSLGAVIGISAAVAAAIAALGVVAYMVWDNWETLKKKAIEIWDSIQKAVARTVDWFRLNVLPVFVGFVTSLRKAWKTLKDGFVSTWQDIRKGLEDFWESIKTSLKDGLKKLEPLVAKIAEVWNYAKERWDYVRPGLTGFFTFVGQAIERFTKRVVPLLETAGTVLGRFFQVLGKVFGPIISGLGGALSKIGQYMATFIEGLIALFTGDWSTLKESVVGVWKSIGGAIWEVLSGIGESIAAWWSGLFDIFRDFSLSDATGTIVEQANLMMDALLTALDELPGRAQEYFDDLGQRFGDFLSTLPEKIPAAIDLVIETLETKLGELAEAALAKLDTLPDDIADLFADLPGKIIDKIRSFPERFRQQFGNARSGAQAEVDTMSRTLAQSIVALVAKIIFTIATLPARITFVIGKAMAAFIFGIVKSIPKIASAVLMINLRIIGVLASLPGTLARIGAQAIAGFIGGILSMARRAAAAAASVIGGAIGAARNVLESHSPSKVFEEMGRWSMEGFAIGIQGNQSEIKAAFKVFRARIAEQRAQVKKWRKDGDISAKTYKAMIKKINAASKLASNSKMNKLIELAKLEEAKKALEDLRKEAQAFADDVKASVLKIGTIKNNMPEGDDIWAPATFSDFQKNMENSLRTAKEFAAKISALRRNGLNSTMLREIIEMGPEAGVEAANMVLSGGITGIKKLNSIQSELDKVATSTSKIAEDAMYKAGLAAAEGLVRGFKDHSKDVENMMEEIAHKMVTAIEKKLGIASPSKVFMMIGFHLSRGLVRGLDRSRIETVRAAERTSRAVMIAMDKDYNMGQSSGVGNSGTSGFGGTSSSTPSTTNTRSSGTTVIVNTQEIDPVLHAQQLGFELAKRGL